MDHSAELLNAREIMRCLEPKNRTAGNELDDGGAMAGDPSGGTSAAMSAKLALRSPQEPCFVLYVA